MADDSEKLRRHVIGLRGLIGNPQLLNLSRKTGDMGQALIETHVADGRFLGGRYAEKGYSTFDLPVFFFGEFEYIERTGNIRISNPETRQSNVLIKADDIRWITTREGKRYAYVKGGYATWLRKTRPGKNLNKVNLQYNGDMMRAFTYTVSVHTNGAEVHWYVRPPQDRKAAFTHRQREWLGFFPDELDAIIEMARTEFGVLIADTTK